MADTRRLAELAARVRAQAADASMTRAAVALSGGADSAVAAWLMLDLRVACRAIHVDHGLPGSPVMRKAAEAIAQQMGIGLTVTEVEVPSGASPENQARTVRYSALESTLLEGELLVTGHTRDDQAETVLLNIMRGTGLDGLAGIPRRRGHVIRPILGVTRSETRELATLLGLPWRDDAANDDLDPRRNQLRRIVIPDLEERFNPRLRSALASLAETAGAELPAQPGRVGIRETDGGVAIAAPELHAAGSAAASQTLREAMRRIRGPHAGTRNETERLLAVARGDAPVAELSGGIRAFRRGPWLIIDRSARSEPPNPVQWALPGGVAFGRWKLDSWIDSGPPVAFPLSSWSAVADGELFPAVANVRTVEREDTIDGVAVHERLRQLGVPADQRSDWPVVDQEGVVVWVPGAQISRAVWVGSATRRYLWVHAAMETP
jgi:tRNA(Ile)-lysidine synthase